MPFDVDFFHCLNCVSSEKVNQNWFTFSSQDFWMNLNWFTLESIYEFVRVSGLFVIVLGWTCFASIACGHPHAHFWGVPQTPSLLLCDDSDADDANDAVLGISLYHIPDSASLASSASFWFCISRNITIFVSSSSKLQASFHYKRDGGDDGDDFSCIPLPISHKHRHYRHHRHLKQASRFNLRLACFILSNVAGFLPHCLLKWI